MNMCYMEELVGWGLNSPRDCTAAFFLALCGLLVKTKFLDSTDATTSPVTQTLSPGFPLNNWEVFSGSLFYESGGTVSRPGEH